MTAAAVYDHRLLIRGLQRPLQKVINLADQPQ